MEHVWTVWAEDVLGPPPKQGRTSFSSDAFADGEVWLQTYVDESEPSALVRIAPDGTATHLTPSSLGFPPGGRIETPFVGSTEALISYFVEALPETGIVQFDSDLQGGCGAQSSDLVWERAVEVAPGSWALFGTQVGQLPARPVYFGDPCQASAQALLPFEQEVFPLLGFEYIDDRFVVSGVAGGEAFVRSFDSDGVQLTAWSSGTSDIAVGAWAGATPDGRVLVADWSSDAVRGGERFTLAYVELDSATAATYTFEALWPPTLTPPRHIIDFDVAEVPWMVYGGADLRISPLPAEGAEPCCPTITDEWLPEELNQFWELYAVPDGLIAITTTSPREGVPEDVIVSRFGFVR